MFRTNAEQELLTACFLVRGVESLAGPACRSPAIWQCPGVWLPPEHMSKYRGCRPAEGGNIYAG